MEAGYNYDLLYSIDFASYVAGFILAGLWMVVSFYIARKRKGLDLGWMFYLLAGFYACIFLSDVYYALTWVVADYPFVFSPGDLSWVGGYFFLITFASGLIGAWPEEKRRAAKRRILPAVAAAAVCVLFTAVNIWIYPDITVNYVLYGVPMAILCYDAARALWSGGGKGPGRPVLIAILVWMADQFGYNLFSTLGFEYGYAIPFLFFSWGLVLTTTGIFWAAWKEARA